MTYYCVLNFGKGLKEMLLAQRELDNPDARDTEINGNNDISEMSVSNYDKGKQVN